MSLSLLDIRYFSLTMRLSRAEARVDPVRNPALDVISASTSTSIGQGDERWQPAVAALGRLMVAQSSQRAARRIRLIVGNDFVRYLLVPWTPKRLDEVEREQFARAMMAERFGEGAGKWRLALERQRFSRPALAAAIDADMFEAVQRLVAENGYRLISVVPALVAELNRFRRRMGKVSRGWLVDASDGRVASLAFHGGAWAQVGNDRYAGLEGGLKEKLPPLLRRDTLRVSALSGATVFLANGTGNQLPGLIERVWPVVNLDA